MLKINNRESLFFTANNLSDERKVEEFKETPCSKEIESISKKLYLKTIEYLPLDLRPESLTIALEKSAKVEFDNGSIKEEIPLSLITSQQVPKNSEIRMGMFEIENDIEAYESILAHELGHMIVEWPTRKKGVVKDSDEAIPFWSKAIYEGVADFFAVVLTGRRIIGSKDIWFNRTIDDYKDYESAKNPQSGTVELAIHGLETLGFDKQYKSYGDWLNIIKKFIAELGEDPYALGTVVARELFELSNKKDAKYVINRIVEIALTGDEYIDPEKFIAKVSKVKGKH